MIAHGLASSIDTARALIMAGRVVVDEHTVDKSGHLFPDCSIIRIKGGKGPYASRGGLKLKKALDEFQVEVTGLVAIDIGASTGGFTDCLLQAGATRVYAIDVGYGQLAWKLRQDPRVVNIERTNIRHVTPNMLDEVPDIAVIDASFISLASVLPAAVSLVKPGGCLIALIKPQFEALKRDVDSGGVVRNADIHERVIENMRQTAVGMGLTSVGICESPITGADGNREFLMLLQIPPRKEFTAKENQHG